MSRLWEHRETLYQPDKLRFVSFRLALLRKKDLSPL